MFTLSNARIRRGPQVLLDEATVTLFRGEKVGIVGRNGCGKSTLLALIRGELATDAGEYRAPAGLTIASVRPERLVRIGDQDAHDDGLSRGLRRRRRGCRPRRRRYVGPGWLGRLIGFNLFCRLVLPQAFERRLAHHAVPGPAGEFDLGDKLRLRPGDTSFFAGCTDPCEW